MREPAKHFYFRTLAEAQAFKEGVEYVNDSQLEIVNCKTRYGMKDGEVKSAMLTIKETGK